MGQIIDDAPDVEEEPTQQDIDAPCITEHEYRAEVPSVENSAFVLQNSHPRPGEMVFFDGTCNQQSAHHRHEQQKGDRLGVAIHHLT